MALSFVEQAILRVVDESSKPIKEINAELAALFKTAKGGKNIKVTIDTKDALARAKALRKELNAIPKVKKVKIDITGLAAATASLTRFSSKIRAMPKAVKLTFAITDLSKKIKKVSLDLKKLQGMKDIKFNIDITGIEKTLAQVKELNHELRALARIKNSAIRVDYRQRGVPGQETTQRVPRNTGGRRQDTIRLVEPKWHFLQLALNGFQYRLSATIENAIITGFTKGIRTRDAADTGLSLLGLSEADKAAAQAGASLISKESPQVGRGDALSLIREAIPLTQGDVAGAIDVSRQIAELVKLQTALGLSSDEALDGAIKYAKAGEQMGAITDAITGKVDPAKVEKFFDTVERGAILIGKEFGPDLVSGFIKYARGSKFGINEEALLTGFLMTEEMGSTAGVGFNEAIKNLSGQKIQKKQLDNLIALGLIDSKQVPAGAVGNMTLTELVGNGAVDEQGLRTNFYQWVRDNLIPKMVELGLDPNNPVDAQKFAGGISSNKTGPEAVAATILRSAELQAQVAMAMGFDVSKAGISKVVDESVVASFDAAMSQLTASLGEAGNALEFAFIPALNNVAKGASFLADVFAGENGKGNPVAVGLAAFGVVEAGSWLLSKINPFTAPAAVMLEAGNMMLAASLGGGGVPSKVAKGAPAALAGGSFASGALAATRGAVRYLAPRVALPVALLWPDQMGDGTLPTPVNEKDHIEFLKVLQANKDMSEGKFQVRHSAGSRMRGNRREFHDFVRAQQGKAPLPSAAATLTPSELRTQELIGAQQKQLLTLIVNATRTLSPALTFGMGAAKTGGADFSTGITPTKLKDTFGYEGALPTPPSGTSFEQGSAGAEKVSLFTVALDKATAGIDAIPFVVTKAKDVLVALYENAKGVPEKKDFLANPTTATKNLIGPMPAAFSQNPGLSMPAAPAAVKDYFSGLGSLPTATGEEILSFPADMASTFNDSSLLMQQTFSTGAAELEAAGSAFGPLAAQAILALGPQIGQAIGQAIAGSVGNLKFQGPAQASGPSLIDTGPSMPRGK